VRSKRRGKSEIALSCNGRPATGWRRVCKRSIPIDLLTADCFELGLNDLIKDIVMNPPDEAVEDGEAEDEEAKVEEDLSDAKVIWGAENQIRYRTHLIYYFHQVAC